MTTTTTTNRKSFTGDGTEAILAITFKFYTAAELIVIRRVTSTGAETTMLLTTDYTVTGGNGSTGTLEVVDGSTDFPSTVTWTVFRDSLQTQTLDILDTGGFQSESIETQLDKLVLRLIDQQEQIDRCLKIPKSDATSLTTEISNSVDRASKALTFDASGNVTVT